MLQQYIKRILTARVYDVAIESPIDHAGFLSERLGNKIILKREDLQPVYSFKLRGACNKVMQLPQEERKRGLVAASAGNHAQGLALVAQQLGLPCTIVMPNTTPDIKVKAVRARGAEAVLRGDTFDEAYAYSQTLVEEKGYVYIHPYDDEDVIAGQGTIAMELLHQTKGNVDAIFVPVGGGGLIAGIAAYIKYLRPEIKVIGVESDESACLYEAMKADERVILDQVGIFADGVAVAQIGENTWKVARDYVDEVVTVSTDEICAAMKDIFNDTRAIAEPAGALGVAGLKKYVAREGVTDKNLVAVVSGANTNFDRLRHVAERAEIGEQREALLAVTIPERPGAFRKFCELLGKRNITEFNYRYADDDQAQIFAGIQLSDQNDRHALVETLNHNDYLVVDLTENEMAKVHVRYMVGGRAENAVNEVIYRFEFPERPGALMRFLNQLGHKWNISMFHYRNHGAAYGRVLAGLQVPEGERELLQEYMNKLGYRYWEETDNPAYQLFLK
ncbi:threonine ammonia-lyase, biosynthetic [Litoribrevibacter albus]|uniref:L-threonine dehydratase n=1 Tax=Litoribrevibacter albus TaxID=1473156 RepID=A0AA37W8Y5_9GAMM|nr:threonine ammonia-lyase, biosynthetic [Litoribrevibacter albus]GLQ32534.1 L-threonine dehydratase [Litoribrevibacter albus]